MVGGGRFTRCALELARFDIGRRSPPGAVCSSAELPSFLSALVFIHIHSSWADHQSAIHHDGTPRRRLPTGRRFQITKRLSTRAGYDAAAQGWRVSPLWDAGI